MRNTQHRYVTFLNQYVQKVKFLFDRCIYCSQKEYNHETRIPMCQARSDTQRIKILSLGNVLRSTMHS